MLTNYVNPLPGVPSVESPFFGELFDPAHEHYQIAKDLHDKGYAVFDFPDEEIAVIADRIARDLHAQYAWEDWHSGSADMRVQDAWQFNDDVRRIATNAKVLDILTDLYGRRAFPFQTLNFAVGTQQHFHTDSVHFSARPERFMCGVWLALEDIGLDQGPLVYYPGSHQWPIYTHEHIGHTMMGRGHQGVFHSMWERLVAAKGVKPERFVVKKGQALIWAANLLHGGDRHVDKSLTRWSQVTHYFFENCTYYSPLRSNEPRGEIAHRKPLNILRGDRAENYYNGELVPSSYIDITQPNESVIADFDARRYLELNVDVALSGVDPLDHYISYGWKEGRVWK